MTDVRRVAGSKKPVLVVAAVVVPVAALGLVFGPLTAAQAAPATAVSVSFSTADHAAGSPFSWTVPAHTGPVVIAAAAGNGGNYNQSGTLRLGGAAALTSEQETVPAGEILSVWIGGDGGDGGNVTPTNATGGAGYGSGGDPGRGYAGGGGSTAVLLGSTPLVVSGAGGGASTSPGGAGGTPAGGNGGSFGRAAVGGNGGIGGAGASGDFGPGGQAGGNGFDGGGGNGDAGAPGGGAGYGGGGGGAMVTPGAGGGSYASDAGATYASRTDSATDGWVTFTYTPLWTVTFDARNGASVPAVSVDNGSPITAPAPPTRTGYTFTGWYTDPTDGTAWDFSDPIAADTILYAQWTAVVPSASAPRDPTLASTGPNIGAWPLIGGGLLLAGTALAILRRRHAMNSRP